MSFLLTSWAVMLFFIAQKGVDNMSERSGFTGGGSNGSSGGTAGGTGRVTSGVDGYLQAYQTRDGTAHVFLTYIKTSDVDYIEDIKLFQVEGIFNLDNMDPVTGYPITYVDVYNISLNEGDFYRTWFFCDEGTTYHFRAVFTYRNHSGGLRYHRWYTYAFKRSMKYSAPSVSYSSGNNTFNISTSVSGRRVVEFERTDGYNPTGKTNNQRLLFYLTSLVNLEFGYSGYYKSKNYYELERWPVGSYTVGVSYTSSVPSSEESRLYGYITDAISKINSALSGTGVSFTVTTGSGDINVLWGTHEELWGWTPSFSVGWYNGTWNTWASNGYIYEGEVKLRYDEVWHQSFEGIVLEELVQCLGCGHDQLELPENTIFSDFLYLNKPSVIGTDDQAVIDILYKESLQPGSYSWEIATEINPPKGHITTFSNSMNLNFLESDKPYRARAWIIQSDGDLSATSNWVYFTTPIRPDNWYWNTSELNAFNGNGEITEISYIRWNLFIDRVNEFRDYKGYSWIPSTVFVPGVGTINTKMSSSDRKLYAERFNAVREAIGNLYSTGITDKSRGDKVYGHYFITLQDSLNSI